MNILRYGWKIVILSFFLIILLEYYFDPLLLEVLEFAILLFFDKRRRHRPQQPFSCDGSLNFLLHKGHMYFVISNLYTIKLFLSLEFRVTRKLHFRKSIF
jgi:hypothetical protein